MELRKLTNRIFYSMFEEERDRPCLGYIKGDRFSIAVDAGHSAAHTEEFYEALHTEGLPLPTLTVITHWHWDHAFGMHRIAGLSIANRRTDAHLREFSEMLQMEGVSKFLAMDETIQKEYAGGKPVIIVPADIVFDEELSIDPGNLTVQLFTCASPHTDDTTLVYIPEEKVLFLGDCISGVFPTWERDPVKAQGLLQTLEEIDAEYFIGGHWTVFEREELREALL